MSYTRADRRTNGLMEKQFMIMLGPVLHLRNRRFDKGTVNVKTQDNM